MSHVTRLPATRSRLYRHLRRAARSVTLRSNVTFLFVLALLVSLFPAATQPAGAQSTPVTVTITKVTALSDGLEGFGRGPADLYAGVTIGGTPTQSSFAIHQDDKDDIEPFWAFTATVTGPGPVQVIISIWDHDDCSHPFCTDTGVFESDDDEADANPDAGLKEIFLNVNLATGAWSGTTTGSCSQGTGDEAVRVCWDISVLSASGDADGDGLLDGWERLGFDADGDGTVDVNLPGFGANPRHRDLFLELDFVAGQAPNAGAIAAMKAAFAAAPLTNPDGVNGVNLWVDTNGAAGGDNFGGGSTLASPIGCLDANFYTAKTNNFNANRRWIFRYAIVGNPADSSPCGGGRGEIGGNDFIEYNHDGGTIMHELGHTLNLHHGGNDDNNCEPNYVSVMNYDNQFGINQAGGGTIIDYSPPRFAGGRGVAPLPQLVENSLNDAVVLDATDATNRFVFVGPNGRKVQRPLNQAADWDTDGNTAETNTQNVNTSDNNGTPANTADDFPQRCANGATNTTLTGFHDWNTISIPFRQFGDSGDGAINPTPDQEPTLVELQALHQALNTTDLTVTKTDAPDPVAAGTQLVYTVKATNSGPNPASKMRVVDTLPSDVTLVSNTGGCAGTPLTCEFGEVLAGTNKEFQITVQVPANLVYTNGGPKTISNSVTVSNEAGPDANSANNTATQTTQVIARADLAIVSFAPVNAPGEMLIGTPLNLTMRKVITNKGPSAPMDVKLTRTASASAGATVSGASNAVETAVALNEQRIVNEQFTLQCSQPGPHTFTFTNTIAPKNAADIDPDLNNNQSSVPVVIECVVPVAINIRPGGTPNSINLNSEVSVAVLTTTAGEYGLPLAFDATTILPLTAQFRAGGLLATGGTTEIHGKGHIEDARERSDEKTRDGDDDMLLHFSASPDTGLTLASTEACVKGQFTSGANTYTFFGCDSVNMVPN
jgi:uncharacterized repeat protein (TIGR01451 family)